MAEKTYQRVARQLEGMIRAGSFAAGRRLPPERELAAQFAVSRTTVREALLFLEAARLIEIRDRSGAYVLTASERGADVCMGLAAAPRPDDVLQLRRLVEGQSAFVAALNAPSSALTEIKQEAERLAEERFDDPQLLATAVRRFHHAVVLASQNPLFADLFARCWGDGLDAVWSPLYDTGTDNDVGALVHQHGRMVARAITQRHAEAARTAVEWHIDWLAERLAEENG